MVVCLRCLLHHILSLIAYTFRENLDFVFIINVHFVMSANIGYVLVCWSCSFVCTLHHLIIIIVQTYLKTLNLLKNACQIYFVECVSKIKRIFSVIHYTIYGAVFLVYPFPLWWLREYLLCLIVIIKSEVWSIIHCLGLGHETMVCAICFCIFLSWLSLANRLTHSKYLNEIHSFRWQCWAKCFEIV